MMSDRDHSKDRPEPSGGFWRSRTGLVLLGFLAVAGLLLVYQHRVHILTGDGILPLLLALCLGMHLFMHGGHGGRGGDNNSDRRGGP